MIRITPPYDNNTHWPQYIAIVQKMYNTGSRHVPQLTDVKSQFWKQLCSEKYLVITGWYSEALNHLSQVVCRLPSLQHWS